LLQNGELIAGLNQPIDLIKLGIKLEDFVSAQIRINDAKQLRVARQLDPVGTTLFEFSEEARGKVVGRIKIYVGPTEYETGALE
ncbi:hypothetical protein FRC11_011737, partial [Ceratobasidium sp. 423]